MTRINQTNDMVLQITPGKVNMPVIEKITDEAFMESAIFGTQYKQMLACLNSYVKHSSSERNDGKQKIFGLDSPNNVFTFVGERGSGKTSCMSSVANLLSSNRFSTFSAYPELAKKQFATIDIIDPSYFDENHNIVATMVAKLYKAYSELDKCNENSAYNRDYRNDLIDAFIHAQRSMRCLLERTDGTEYESDDIENLSDLSMAIDLKEDICKLVQTYLKFIGKQDGYLVLCIDDIDLNISEADTMAEQIRKYLVNPNIIILLAVKLEQLVTIKNLHYAEHFDHLLKDGHMDFGTVEEMTGQFLSKFAPQDQRVYMPSSEVYFNSLIDVGDAKWTGHTVMQAVPELIFCRTKYLFYNSRHTPSLIIPRNLRKLCQLVSTLLAMGDDTANNKSLFQNYLFGSWIQDNLTWDDRTRAHKLLEGWRNEQLNRIAIDVLHEKYGEWIANKQSEEYNLEKDNLKEELKALFDERNREFNLSVGDVLSMIDILEISFESHSDKCFYFFLKSLYSIALYEAYNRVIFENYHNIGVIGDSLPQVLLYDPFEEQNINSYQKLVGGRYFNYRLRSVLAKETIPEAVKQYVSRTDRMISYARLNGLIETTVKDWQSYNDNNGAVTNENWNNLRNKIRLCEFFMLCCIRDINLRNRKGNSLDYYDSAFRQEDTVYYSGDYTGKERLYFDLGAFIFNVSRIRTCYKRYKDSGKNFLLLCEKDQECLSLYSRYRKLATQKNPNRDYNRSWLSWTCIRNAEVIMDLNQHLRSKCKEKDGDNLRSMKLFFKALSEYRIPVYNTDDNEQNSTINFEFASEIADLFENEAIRSLFNDIYTFDLPIQLIDIQSLLKGRQKERNKKITVYTYLMNEYSSSIKSIRQILDSIFSAYGENMTRAEIEQAGERINAMLKERDGNSTRNLEDSVS